MTQLSTDEYWSKHAQPEPCARYRCANSECEACKRKDILFQVVVQIADEKTNLFLWSSERPWSEKQRATMPFSEYAALGTKKLKEGNPLVHVKN